MLKGLLNSKLKKRLLKALFSHSSRAFCSNELKEMVGGSAWTINQSMKDFLESDVIREIGKKRKKYYQINPYFNFYEEVLNLLDEVDVPKVTPATKEIKKLKNAKLVLLTGVFTYKPHLEADLVVVGEDIPKKVMQQVSKKLGEYAGQEINYAVMNMAEFMHRKNISDRFLRDVLDNSHIVVINRTRNKNVFN